MSDNHMDRLLCIREQLIDEIENHASYGLDQIDTHELGEIIDMIKDIYEAQKDCAKACYYQTVTESMHENYMSKLEMMWQNADIHSRMELKNNLMGLLDRMK